MAGAPKEEFYNFRKKNLTRAQCCAKEEFTGEVSIGPVTGNLSLEIPIVEDKSSLIVGGRGTYSDWILNLLEDESLEDESSFSILRVSQRLFIFCQQFVHS